MKRRMPLPISIVPVIRKIAEQRLVNVKHPNVLTVAGHRHRPCERQRLARHNLRIRQVALPVHVPGNGTAAYRRNGSPRTGVSGLHRETPAVAEEAVAAVGFFIDEDVEAGLWGGEGGESGEQDEEREVEEAHLEIRGERWSLALFSWFNNKEEAFILK